MKKYNKYIQNFQCNNLEIVDQWIESNLKNHLKDNQENQDEIEHILDYLCSSDAPKRLQRVSYTAALENSKKWMKKQIKKGNHIEETSSDTELILELTNGFKWVKLVGENAFKREGFLMRHCVASYYGSSTSVYSLRDSKNNPHCTVEEDKQIKGKGNGSISPKYIKYVVEFLEHLGMSVSDNEMKNLGYFNYKEFKNDLHKDTLALAYGNYLPISSDLKDKEGEPFFDLSLIDALGLINERGFVNIDLSKLSYGVDRLLNSINNASSEDYSQNASSRYSSQNVSSGNYSQNASSGYGSQNASSGYGSQNASSGDYAKNASSGYGSQNANSGNYSQNVSSGNYSQNASSGYRSQNASSGYNSKNASSGDYSKNASSRYSSQNVSSGNYSQNASSGDNSQNASSGNYSQNASSGDNSQNASSGDYAKNASSGYDSKNASSGYDSKNASSGDYSKNASSGDYSKNASSGDYSKNASSGYSSQNASSGNYSKNASSGDNTIWDITGDNSIVASIGKGDKVKASLGTWVTLAEYNEDNSVKTVVSKRIDGKTLKEDVYYTLVDGKFTEIK